MECLLSTGSHRPGLSVGKDDISGGLRSLGLEAGALVLVHSSLSSLGHVSGGAGAVVRALLEVVGPEGTLVLPAFVGPGEVWEGLETPTTMGAVPSAFLGLPDTRRSSHPTHSVAAQGPLAEELVRDHPLGPAMGPGSPFHRLLERDAWVLLLGVDCQTSAMMHLPEQDLGLPKIGTRVVEIREPDGQLVSLTLEGAPGCSRGFYKLEAILRERGVLREGTIGLAHVMLMQSQDLYRVEMEVLQEDPDFLLCDNPACAYSCRRQAPARGPWPSPRPNKILQDLPEGEQPSLRFPNLREGA